MQTEQQTQRKLHLLVKYSMRWNFVTIFKKALDAKICLQCLADSEMLIKKVKRKSL